jgi:hypothetical protein
LEKDVATCRISCELALRFLGLNVGATTVETLQRLDGSIGQQAKDLANNMTNLQLTNEANKTGIGQLLADRRHHKDESWVRKVIGQLAHPDIHSCKDTIDQTYSNNIDCMLSTDAQYSERNAALIDFFQSGSGIFWVRGKSGSGKSTFMKFLMQHRITVAFLNQWAGSNTVLISSHFFWVAGSPWQKTYQGMLQSLLYQVLSADVTLASEIITEQEARRLREANDINFWTEQTLLECLLAALARRSRHHCFFIDGLDECQPERDHPRLLATIYTLASFDHVNIVASSRPWAVFQQKPVNSARNLTM